MKFSASLALIVIVGLVASSSALPAKKRTTYLAKQRTHARSTHAALVADSEIGAADEAVVAAFEGAVAEDNQVQQVEVEIPVEADVAVAAEETAVEQEVENTDAKVPRDYNFDAEAELEVDAAPVAEVEAEVAAVDEVAFVPVAAEPIDVAADLPAPAPIAPVATPARRYQPVSKKTKKVAVAATATVENEAEALADDDDEEYDAVPVRKSTKAAAKPTKGPLPAGTFFPIDFGGNTGGAIAVANSFSIGDGGSATSHAIAYGSEPAAQGRKTHGKVH